MPTPTREQFDKAMQAVLSSAPAGLSKEQFYGLIDKQLGMDQLKTANETPLREPTTYEAGRNASLLKTVKDTGLGMIRGLKSVASTAIHGPDQFQFVPGEKPEQTMVRLKAYDEAQRNQPLPDISDPNVGGQILGQLAVGLVAPRVIPKIPAGLSRTGAALESAGTSLQSSELPLSGAAGAVGYALDGPKGAAVGSSIGAGTPRTLRGVGRVIRATGDAMGGSKATTVPGVEQFGPANKSGLPDGRELPQNISGSTIYSKDVPPTQTVRGSGIPDTTPYTPVDNSFASTSGYKPGEFGEGAGHIEGSGIDPHLPNTSGYLPHEFGEAALPLEGAMGVDRYMPNKSGLSDLRMEELLDKFGGQGEEGAVVGPPADSGHPAAPETRSTYPTDLPEDWHSGAKPGSPEARRAQSQHKLFRELDNDYRRKLDDPLAALLMSLGAGAGAATLEKRQ